MTHTQVASIGRIVHYTSYGTPGGEYLPECRAAIVTEAGDPSKNKGLGLCVLNPTGLFFNQNVMGDGSFECGGAPQGGTWHWPERVEGSK